jgi:hypothetical protein
VFLNRVLAKIFHSLFPLFVRSSNLRDIPPSKEDV